MLILHITISRTNLLLAEALPRNGVVIVDQTLTEIGGLLAFAETQSDHGLPAAFFIRHANGKVPTAVTDGLYVVVHCCNGQQREKKEDDTG